MSTVRRTTYSAIQGRQRVQCRRCRHQTSLIAGTVLHGTKLPMRVWFRARHLLGQGKKGISNIELGRRLEISTNAAWRLQHNLIQAMLETKRLCARVAAGTTVVSDGGQWFRYIAEQPGLVHERHVTDSDRAAARHPAFRWANTVLANVKNSLLATHRVVGAKHLPRYLGAFAWRFKRRLS